MQKDKIFKTILLFCIPLLVLSCSKTAGDDSPGQDANLALALITRSENGDLAITGEDRFTSLAVYIFNNDNGDLEFSELITDFTPESSASLYTKSVRVTQDKKAVYAIANYAGQSFTAAGQPVTITEQTPRSVLDALQVASATFAGNDIVMVGKKVVEMTGTAVNASIEMERLVGRLDLHVYKAAELTDDAVELVSIIFCNQVTKSNVQYQSNAMARRRYPPDGNAYTFGGDFAGSGARQYRLCFTHAVRCRNVVLQLPEYFRGNRSVGSRPDDSSTPYLLVNVK